MMRIKISRTSLLFTLLSLTASALNFLYYPAIAHILDLASFGDVQIGVSFVMQAAALFSSLNLVALFISSRGGVSGVTARLERVLLLPCIVGALCTAILAQPIATLLQLHDPSLIYLLAIIFLLNIPASTWLGTVQGEGRFVQSGWIAVISSLLKIASGALLALTSLGAHGAILGIMIGTACIIPLAYAVHGSGTLRIRHTLKLPSRSDFAFLVQHPVIPTLLMSFLLLALLATLDITFAKVHLTPEIAGEFAQLSVAAKIAYFVATPLSVLMFQHFITHPQQRHGKLIGVYSLGLVVVSVLIATCLPFIMTLLFGHRLSTPQLHVGLILIAAFCALSILGALIYLTVAKRHPKRALFLVTIAFVATIVLLITSTSNALDIALRYLVGLATTTVAASVALRYTE